MDDRQTKIREGAGLEDSRVNQEFVDFLKKWSSPVLMVFAFAALAWAGMQYLERQKVAKVENAFSQLASATQGGNPSDSSLKAIASEFAGTQSVPELALLMTTDIYLEAFASGVQPGTEFDAATGLPMNETDILDDAQRQVYLDQAGKVANQVLDSTRNVAGKELLAMQAMSRLASVKEGKRDFDGAKGMYQSLESMATAASYPSMANYAAARISNLDALKEVAALPSEGDLVSLPGELSLEEIQEMIDSVQYDETDDAETNGVDSVETPVETPVESSSETPAEEPESP